MRENCTYSLSGGRWPARQRATSDPTARKRSNAGQGGPKEIVEGRPLTKENAEEPTPNRTPSREIGPSGLDRVREAAKGDPKMRFTALLHHVNIELLRSSYLHLKRGAAAGVDGVTWQEYGDGLEERLKDLHGRIHRGAYHAKPSRRVWIAKADGRQRPKFGRRCRAVGSGSVHRFMDQVRALTSRRVPLKTKELIEKLNPVLRGWGHHYKRAHVRKLFHRLDGWIVRRIRSHRFKRWRNGGWRQLPETKLYGEYGLVNLIQLIPSIASRKRESS